jgi:Domain of unknown function (DUF6398)
MLLDPQELALFFRLHRTLMFFVNQRLQPIPDKPTTPGDFAGLSPEKRLTVRGAFLAHLDLIDAFVGENSAQLPEEELVIVHSWRQLVTGKFYVFRELKKYTVFLSTSEPPIAYGILALAQPFEELIGPYLPVLVEAVLLPFKDKIVYDGLMTAFPISFGAGIKRMLNEGFKKAKAWHGIVTALPVSQEPVPPKPPTARPAPKPPAKEEKDEILQVVLGLIEPFCREQLNEEYAVLCRKLAEKLARKRPSPLLSGQPNTWASGIVRTIGMVNFLSDKTQTPHMRLSDIDAHFGVSESSGAAKSAAIRKLLKIHAFDHQWTLPSRLEDSPLVWMVSVNGFIMDIRQAPREAQVVAFEKGLIPYIPADRQE